MRLRYFEAPSDTRACQAMAVDVLASRGRTKRHIKLLHEAIKCGLVGLGRSTLLGTAATKLHAEVADFDRQAARSMQAAGAANPMARSGKGADAPGVLQLIPKTQEEKSVRAATLSLTI